MEARMAEMQEKLDEQSRSMQTRLDKQSRSLQAKTEELDKERASRRGDIAEAGNEPRDPTVATSDRAQDYLLNRFVSRSLQRAGLFVQPCLY